MHVQQAYALVGMIKQAADRNLYRELTREQLGLMRICFEGSLECVIEEQDRRKHLAHLAAARLKASREFEDADLALINRQ